MSPAFHWTVAALCGIMAGFHLGISVVFGSPFHLLVGFVWCIATAANAYMAQKV